MSVSAVRQGRVAGLRNPHQGSKASLGLWGSFREEVGPEPSGPGHGKAVLSPEAQEQGLRAFSQPRGSGSPSQSLTLPLLARMVFLNDSQPMALAHLLL